MNSTITVPLYRLAHGRTGDKGNRSNISVIAWHPDLWDVICEQVTEHVVMNEMADRKPSKVTRYLLPKIQAMNLVIDDVLDGGVNDSLNLDSHGKTLCYRILQMSIDLPSHLEQILAGPKT